MVMSWSNLPLVSLPAVIDNCTTIPGTKSFDSLVTDFVLNHSWVQLLAYRNPLLCF